MRLVFLALALSLTSTAHAIPTDHACIGHWVGAGQNSNGPPWSIDLWVRSASASCGHIEYVSPDLRCGANLERCSFVPGRGVAYEIYTHNVGCEEGGNFDMRCEGDVMHWEFHGWETVRTTLHRAPGGGGTPQPVAQPGSPPTPTPGIPSSTPSNPSNAPSTPSNATSTPSSTPTPPMVPPSQDAGLCSASAARGSSLPGWLAWAGILAGSAFARRRRPTPRRSNCRGIDDSRRNYQK